MEAECQSFPDAFTTHPTLPRYRESVNATRHVIVIDAARRSRHARTVTADIGITRAPLRAVNPGGAKIVGPPPPLRRAVGDGPGAKRASADQL